MFLLLRYITIGLVFLSLCTAAEHPPTASNREIFYRLSDSLLTQAAGDLNVFRSMTVTASQDAFSSFFYPIFVQVLASRSLPVYIQSDSSEAVLQLTVRQCSVIYSDVFSETIFGSRKTERSLNLSVTGTVLSSADGKVIWTKQFSAAYADTVNLRETDGLASGSPPLTAFIPPELSLFDSILEPAIVTIASGVAIYLFFTIRS